ncbi:MAG: ATP-binding protein, partial [Candidatus Aminicenantes bacterium]
MKKASLNKELPPEKLAWRLSPEKIPFENSSKCQSCEGIIGQDRAIQSIQTGLDVKSLGYNIFITGMVGTGRTTTIKQLLEKLEKEDKTPDDILYVNNFKTPDEPTLITLPSGKGKLFRDAMEHLIEMLKTNIPELLKSSYYSEKRDSIIDIQQKKQKEILKAFEDEVAKEGFSVIQVQMGLYVKPDLIPVIEGKPTPFPQLENLVREEKFEKAKLEELKEKYDKLTGKLEEVFKHMKETEEETHRLLKEWDQESITPIIKGAVLGIRNNFAYDVISDYLDDVELTLTKRINIFKGAQKPEKEPQVFQQDPFIEYKVNLLIDNSELKNAPVIMETNPNYINLFGSIESTMNRFGLLQTDFTKIKAGSFLKANGGYLIINSLDALIEPGVWNMLKRTLRNQTLEIQNFMSIYLVSTSRLKPQPIEIDVKVVMIGESHIYNLLYYLDADFKKIFKIKAEFDSEMDKDNRTIMDYAAFI